MELHELEVTEPREDFELEVKRTTQAVRTGDVGDLAPARALRPGGPHLGHSDDLDQRRPGETSMLRLLHTADVHLGAQFDIGGVITVEFLSPKPVTVVTDPRA